MYPAGLACSVLIKFNFNAYPFHKFHKNSAITSSNPSDAWTKEKQLFGIKNVIKRMPEK